MQPIRWPHLLAACLSLLLPARTWAQEGGGVPTARAAPGALAGVVMDAGTGQPLAGVTVVLEPLPGGVLPARGASPSAFLQVARSVGTDDGGRYRFDGLARGRYRLRVERLGYRGTTVEVELGRGDANVSMGLPLDPIALQPVTVTDAPGSLAARPPQSFPERAGGRLLAARIRQRRFLATDARELTHFETVEAATLGEPDIFRAVQRLPGVTTRDDYTAELWTRGATWDETRVSFDGLPLFHPLHGLGVFAGISPDAVGAASFHPGVRPASLAEGAAGSLDIVSRASDATRLHGSGDLSVTSAALSLEGPLPDSSGGWTLSLRRSYLDLFTRSLAALTDEPDLRLPYAFTDVEGRADVGLGGGAALEASGLWEDDRVHGDIVGDPTSARWGNGAGRVTLDAPMGALRLRHTGGATVYSTHARRQLAPGVTSVLVADSLDPSTRTPTDLQLRHAFVAGELAPAAASGTWQTGWELVSEAMEYHGPPPTYYGWADVASLSSLITANGGGPHGVPVASFLVPRALTYGVVWGEGIWRIAPGLELEPGLRLEAGESVPNGGSVRPGPRLTARWTLRPGVALSAGAGRTFQYTQVLAAVGPSPHPAFNASRLFVLAGDSVPALRADIASAGGEAWFAGGWLASANGYVRHTTGIVRPDPTPRAIDSLPDIVHARNDAYGAELSLRRLVGSWTASAEYGYTVSHDEAAGLRYPAAADRRHAASLTAMTHVAPTLRVGAGYRLMSGAPYTRYFAADPVCATASACAPAQRARLGPPGAQRTSAYESVDVLAEWTQKLGATQLGVYLQLRNAFDHRNPAAYGGSTEYCTGTAAQCVGAVYVGLPGTGTTARRWTVDRFEPGLPRLPIVGLRATF